MDKNVVANAVFMKDNKVLLEKRKEKEDNYAGMWAFPGGHKNEKETIEGTLHREMEEELNVKIIKDIFLGEFEDIDPTSKEPYVHNAFLCTEWSGEIKGTTEEESVRWVEIDKVADLENVSKPTLKIIEKIKEEK